MLIGEISKRTQFSRDTIRFYEKKGLIKVRQSDSLHNNYKQYSAKNLEHLLLIKKAKGYGFTLNEIADLLELIQNNQANCTTLRSKVLTKVDNINKQIQELEKKKMMILRQLSDAQGHCNNEIATENCKQL